MHFLKTIFFYKNIIIDKVQIFPRRFFYPVIIGLSITDLTDRVNFQVFMLMYQ